MHFWIFIKKDLKNRYRKFQNEDLKNGYGKLGNTKIKTEVFRMPIGTLVLVLLLSVFLNTAAAAAHHLALQQGLAEEVVRFHILANSDSEEDQAVKYLVRDAVLQWISDEWGDTQNTADARADRTETLHFLSENLPQIEDVANTILEEQNLPYRAEAEICQSYFPDRTYGGCTFPAGWYEALRIRLGEAKGQNWWCLLYPALCFSDCFHAVMEEDALTSLEETLTVEEYEALLGTPSQWKISFRWFNFF
ncbi:MAG: stage II sporulation protein R [Lachnospiraceae bacterium]|nr:stage II sporulation protein R [Lachnospiraceae bacterium]